MLKTVSHWSSFLLVISSGCRVLLLSLHIRVSSAGSGGNKVQSPPFMWFDQQILEVFLLELGLHQWAVNLRRESLSSMAFPKFFPLSLSCLYLWSCQTCVNLSLPQPSPCWHCYMQMSAMIIMTSMFGKGMGHEKWILNSWSLGFSVDSLI